MPGHSIRIHAETWLTRFAFLTIPRLPRSVVVGIAHTLGSLGICFSRKLKRVGLTNLDLAFGEKKSRAEKLRILKISFQTMALVILDTFWFSRNTVERVSRYVSFDPSFHILFRQKPHVTISAHYGNWELLGMGITQAGFPLHSVAKPLKNPKVDELFDEVRNSTGQKIVKRQGAVRTLFRILKQGGKIGLIMDQNTLLSEGGQFFDFFGLPAGFSTAGSALAIKTNSDIIVCALKPRPDGTYLGDFCREISVAPFLTMDTDQAVTALTRETVRAMEQFIREQPEYWLWFYKRWKYVPAGDDAARFPFYARNAV